MEIIGYNVPAILDQVTKNMYCQKIRWAVLCLTIHHVMSAYIARIQPGDASEH